MRENAEPRRRRDSGSSSSSERESRRRARQSSTVTLRRGYSPFLFKKDQQQDAHHHNHLWFLALIGCLLLPSPLGEKGSTTGVSLKYTPPSPEEMFFSPDYSDEHFFDAFKTTRPLGIRWRGDAEYLAQRNRRREVTLMPVLVQQPPNIQHHRQHLPSTSRSDSEPSLEEIELIDVLWRSDLSGISEKGTVLEQQEETDLAALTHKSITGSLSQDEALRYEELSKGYFEDFYAGSTPSTCQSSLDFEGRCYSESSLPSCSNPVSPLLPQQQQKSSVDLTTPTDAELDALFNDMLHKDSSLEHSLGFAQHPLMHNVSLGVPLTQSNLTEGMPHMNFGCESQCGVPTVGVVPATPSIPSAAFNGSHFWNNHTEGPLPPYLRTDGINNLTMAVQQMCHSEPVLAEIGAVSTYPANPLHNVASLQVPYIPNNGALYDNFGSRRSLSISNESSIDSSSTSSSTSPRYNSEAENHSPNQSRFYGKLIPNPIEEHEKFYEKNRLSMSCSVLPRRRGRQSKDEQLAMSYRLPASAALISDMSLPELQKMLRSEDLSEDQKALIRKIRRRGKNKVAARTCRQRRGETKGMPPSPQPNAHLATWNEPSRTLYRRQ